MRPLMLKILQSNKKNTEFLFFNLLIPVFLNSIRSFGCLFSIEQYAERCVYNTKANPFINPFSMNIYSYYAFLMEMSLHMSY